MSRNKIYLSIIILIAITLFVECTPQYNETKILSKIDSLILKQQELERRTSSMTIKTSDSEIIVPKQGLIFKTEDGKSIAKITSGKNGGILSILNNQGKEIIKMGAIHYPIQTGERKTIIKTYGTHGIEYDTVHYEIDVPKDYDPQEGGSISIFDNQNQEDVIRISVDKYGGRISMPSVEINGDNEKGGYLTIYNDRGKGNLIWP